MGLEDSHGQEKRLLLFTRQELGGPSNRVPVSHLHVAHLHAPPVEGVVRMAGHLVREEAAVFSPAFEVIDHQVLIRNEVKILVPLIGWIKAVGVVVHLAPPGHVITVVLEVMRQGNEIRVGGPPPVTIAVETSGGCAPAGQDGRPTRSALGAGRMGVGEQEPSFG